MKNTLRLLLALTLGTFVMVASAAPPNVVVIVSDDHHWGDYGFMGHPQLQTPHLDKLAKESLVFSRGYVPSSLCSPSLASIVTGRYPHEHRITSNDPTRPDGMSRSEFYKSKTFQAGRALMVKQLDEWPILPKLLGQSGYVSFQTGKWWLGSYTNGGFTAGMSRGGRHGDTGLDIGRKTMQPIYDFIAGAKKESKPFFVWYAPMMPHDPHTPPARLLAKYRDKAPSEAVAKYWAMIEWFDETCGDLFAHLEREGLAKDTIVIYVADNGRYYFTEGVYCCAGTCSHVWHYAQAIARIFPEIERDIRERVDYGIGFKDADGMMAHRGELGFSPATDGHAGSILRTLREHQMSPDAAFLKRNWPKIKQAVEWLVAQDENGDGLISRGQPNTLDAEWFGEIAWISSLYVAALKAGAELAQEMGDTAAADKWTAIAAKGSEQIAQRLFHKDQPKSGSRRRALPAVRF